MLLGPASIQDYSTDFQNRPTTIVTLSLPLRVELRVVSTNRMPLVAVAAYGFGLIAGLWTASCILGLVRNYIKARQLGLKIIVNPIHSLNPLWILLTPWIWPMIMRLPFGLDYYFNYTNIDWPYRDKYREHEKYGRAFVVVNPVWVMIYVADPAAIDDIFSRRKDFTKPEIFYSENLSTSRD